MLWSHKTNIDEYHSFLVRNVDPAKCDRAIVYMRICPPFVHIQLICLEIRSSGYKLVNTKTEKKNIFVLTTWREKKYQNYLYKYWSE